MFLTQTKTAILEGMRLSILHPDGTVQIR